MVAGTQVVMGIVEGVVDSPRPEDAAAVEQLLAHRRRRGGHQSLAERIERIKDRLGNRVGLKLLEGGADVDLRVLKRAADDADGLGDYFRKTSCQTDPWKSGCGGDCGVLT